MFAYYFSLIPVYSIIICTYYMRVQLLLYFYTLIGSVFDDSGFAHPDVGCFILLIRCSMRSDMLRELWVLTIRFLIYLLSFISLFPWFLIYCSHCLFYSLFICYHVWSFICYITVLSYHHRDYIACSGYFRLKVYMWGILLAYIRHWLSSWLCFHAFWEAGRDSYIEFVELSCVYNFSGLKWLGFPFSFLLFLSV